MTNENDNIPDCPHCGNKLTEMDVPNNFRCTGCNWLYTRDEATGKLKEI